MDIHIPVQNYVPSNNALAKFPLERCKMVTKTRATLEVFQGDRIINRWDSRCQGAPVLADSTQTRVHSQPYILLHSTRMGHYEELTIHCNNKHKPHIQHVSAVPFQDVQRFTPSHYTDAQHKVFRQQTNSNWLLARQFNPLSKQTATAKRCIVSW